MRPLIALCAAMIVGALPLGASAASADHIYDLRTRIVEQSPGVGEFDGSLRLHVSADGYVSGYYRPDDNPRFIPVTGGTDGGRFWIDIGTFALHPLHFSGTFANGKIAAQANGLILDDGHLTGLSLFAGPGTG